MYTYIYVYTYVPKMMCYLLTCLNLIGALGDPSRILRYRTRSSRLQQAPAPPQWSSPSQEKAARLRICFGTVRVYFQRLRKKK